MLESTLTHLVCTGCQRTVSADEWHGTCPDCGHVLAARYDLERARRTFRPAELAARPWTLWRYAELLPVCDPRFRLTLGEGGTPLLPAPRLARTLGLRRLWLKDESRNPTGSFKSRGLAVAVSRAIELGARAVALPSAGNAAAALSAYAARAGIPAFVFLPMDTPPSIVRECLAYGARVYRVRGLITDCGRLVRRFAAERGWADLSTLREPYRAEGKKTMGFELVEQLGWRLPDVIVYPTGGEPASSVWRRPSPNSRRSGCSLVHVRVSSSSSQRGAHHSCGPFTRAPPGHDRGKEPRRSRPASVSQRPSGTSSFSQLYGQAVAQR